MNLKQTIKFIKRFYNWSDQEVSEYLGVSRSQITKVNAGYWQGISSETIRRVSQMSRISIDELLENQFFPPSYHISKHIHSVYISAEKDYPEFSILKGDYLYIRPFIYDPSKLGELVLVQYPENYRLEVCDKNTVSKAAHFHIVGIARILYKPLESIEFQKKMMEPTVKPVKKRGAPLKF